jgi:8-oxo-dGTP diphosphatase
MDTSPYTGPHLEVSKNMLIADDKHRLPTRIPVVAAVLLRGGRALVAQRPTGKHLALKWEFPGGKVEPGESPEEALRREIREELGVIIVTGRRLPSVVHQYETTCIELTAYCCSLASLESEPCAHEHAALRWVSLEELKTLDLAPADIPLLAHLGNELKSQP